MDGMIPESDREPESATESEGFDDSVDADDLIRGNMVRPR